MNLFSMKEDKSETKQIPAKLYNCQYCKRIPLKNCVHRNPLQILICVISNQRNCAIFENTNW